MPVIFVRNGAGDRDREISPKNKSNQVPCLVDAEVDAYGYLFGGAESAPPGALVQDIGDQELEVEWEPGSTGRKPNIFAHNFIRDFVFGEVALQALRDLAGSDLKVTGTLRLGDQVLSAVRAEPVLPVGDESRSIPSEYSWTFEPAQVDE